jgi:hypothetical protein
MSKEETFKFQSRKISSSNCLKGWMAFNTHWTVYLRNPVRNLPLHTSHYSTPPNKKRKLVDDNVMVIDNVSPKSSQSPNVKYPKYNV